MTSVQANAERLLGSSVEKVRAIFKQDPGTVASSAIETVGVAIGLGIGTAGDPETGRNVMYGGIIAGNVVNFAVQAYQVIQKRGRDWQGDVKDFVIRATGGLSSIALEEIADTLGIPKIAAVIPFGFIQTQTTMMAADFKAIVGKLHATEKARDDAKARLSDKNTLLREIVDMASDSINADAPFLGEATISVHEDEAD